MSNESLMVSLAIDIHEGRNVGVANVPCAYLHAELSKKKRVVLKLVGICVDIMCEVHKEYEIYAIYEGKKKYYIYVFIEHSMGVSNQRW